MSVNPEARRQQLENLQEFIEFSGQKIRTILETLGWEPEKVLEESSLITCSLDTAHKIPRRRADQHIEKCSLRKGGYDLNGLFLSEPVNNPKSSLQIDDYKKIEIISEHRRANKDYRQGWNGQDPDPKTADRLTSTYSTQERLALYEYAASATTGPPLLPDYDVVHSKRDDSKPLTYEEQLAQERDAKRRRIKYKTIHTSHKNHTEVLRELIDGQMELYKDWLDHNDTEELGNDEVKAERERSVASRNSARSDGSRREKRRRKSSSDRDRHREKRRSSSRRDDGNKRRSEHRERSPRRQSKYNDSRKRRSRERPRSRGRN